MNRKDTIEKILSTTSSKAQTFKDIYYLFVDDRNLNEVDVYKKAQINRKTYSKFRSDWEDKYHFNRDNTIKICLSLELNLEETMLLLGSAGYGLGFTSRDKLIIDCIKNEIYDVMEVNDVLADGGETIFALA